MSPLGPPPNHDSTVTDAGDSSIRKTDSSGASRACATSVLIGVTWLTIATVLPAGW